VREWCRAWCARCVAARRHTHVVVAAAQLPAL
jgi:hypothetical protein